MLKAGRLVFYDWYDRWEGSGAMDPEYLGYYWEYLGYNWKRQKLVHVER